MKHEHVEHVNWLVQDTVGEWFGVGLEGDALRSWRRLMVGTKRENGVGYECMCVLC